MSDGDVVVFEAIGQIGHAHLLGTLHTVLVLEALQLRVATAAYQHEYNLHVVAFESQMHWRVLIVVLRVYIGATLQQDGDYFTVTTL